MLKSGLIIGAVMLVLGGLLGFVFPLCVPCLALFAGAGAGYLAGMFDKPGEQGKAVKSGAASGAVGGVGALVGHLGGGLATALVVGPQGANDMMRQFGFDLPPGGGPASDAGYYVGALGTACCFGVVDIALMAGLGALGGMLWYRMTNQNSGMGTPPASSAPTM
jgi:hypothetical protein